jgi:peptide/nickel transport system permease protein
MYWNYLVKRLAISIITFFVAACIIFLLLRTMPGDFVSNLVLSFGNTLPQETVEAFYHANGLDRPLHVQLVTFFSGAFTFNTGTSFLYGVPAGGLIADRIGWTLLLLVPAAVFSLFIGVLLGVWSSWKQGSGTDSSLLAFMMAVRAIPSYWWGTMAILFFAFLIPFFPLGGYTSLTVLDSGLSIQDVLWHAALPVVVLTLVGIPGTYYLMRNSMIHTLQEDYILFARARGLPETRVMRHAFRCALLPVITMSALQIAGLIMGSVFVETVFSWPGVGLLTTEALQNRDLPVLEAIFLLDTVAIIVANLVVDLSYPLLDPRVKRYGE